jgi:putative transposase
MGRPEQCWQDIPDHQFVRFQNRVALIELLLDETVPLPDKQQIKHEFMLIHRRKERTIRHWCQIYRERGPEALLFYKPRFPAPHIREESLKQKIISLVQEVPMRSVPKIRELIARDDQLAPLMDRYSNRTVYRFLEEHNLTQKQRRALAYRDPGRAAYKQFEAEYSLKLIQGDARDGIWLPGKDGKPWKTYLFLWIDDYSRKILFGKYYLSEKLNCMEDSFKHAILRYGIPERCYLDNGSVYISKQFAFVLKELNCKKIHHKPYQAWAKGKVEVINRIIKLDFQQEAQAANIQTVEELNASFWAWAELVYNKRINSTTGETPDERFINGLKEDQRRIDDIAEFQSYFLVRDTRTVTKYGQVKVSCNKYPVTKSPIKTVVGIRYDPCDLSEIHIYDQKQETYLETTTPSKQVRKEVPHIPEETGKNKQQVSEDSVLYFSKLREEFLKEHTEKQTVNFARFFESRDKQENTQ